ncbi:uncharacterized protein B0H18DRAFT_1040303 [Fomitopsis serialis]|uniref:uncharacterized protein n=1 Tax=Fomitopsis serialis TaxID=139415 RepID=UPI002007585C|nr:uncharacterized protein B0H18DRAFT_1040303 [Neoantrodia serialis]KAH9915752.1 hypothetical protein B0H18DRAFT_1040303 [Neoantrodia serialis]
MTPCALPLFHVRLVSYSHLPVRMHRLNAHLRPLHQPFHSIPYRTTPRNDHQRSSPPPDGDDLQFLDIQLGPASTNLEVDEFLQLRAVRRRALSAERAARSAEAKLAELVRTAAKALLPPRAAIGRSSSGSSHHSASYLRHTECSVRRQIRAGIPRRQALRNLAGRIRRAATVN